MTFVPEIIFIFLRMNPNCKSCGADTKEVEVKKDGPNKGRKFWGCTNRDCQKGFNGFVDGNQSAAASSGFRSAAAMSASSAQTEILTELKALRAEVAELKALQQH